MVVHVIANQPPQMWFIDGDDGGRGSRGGSSQPSVLLSRSAMVTECSCVLAAARLPSETRSHRHRISRRGPGSHIASDRRREMLHVTVAEPNPSSGAE